MREYDASSRRNAPPPQQLGGVGQRALPVAAQLMLV
jgi:hypothetical protein